MSLSYVDKTTGLLALVKQPGTNRTFTMDFSAALLGAKIQSVVSVESSKQNKVVGSAPLLVGSPVFDNYTVSFKLGGGTSGEDYKITVVIVDTANNTIEGDGLLVVKEA